MPPTEPDDMDEALQRNDFLRVLTLALASCAEPIRADDLLRNVEEGRVAMTPPPTDPTAALRTALDDLRAAVELADTRTDARDTSPDGTVAEYTISATDWNRVVAVARGSKSEAAERAIAPFRGVDAEYGARLALNDSFAAGVVAGMNASQADDPSGPLSNETPDPLDTGSGLGSLSKPDDPSGPDVEAWAKRLADADRDALTFAVIEAGRRLSDKRTLMDDGFWVSKREMRYLDNALAEFDESLPTAADVKGILSAAALRESPDGE